jgi:3-methylfumaryl-CoA hydratase
MVRHEIRNASGLAITEEQDIVYRGLTRPGDLAPAQPAPANAAWERSIHPDDVLLFRYSALTFNGHRIHYDWRYCIGKEGYPGLVVHGPLIATLLLDLLRRNRPEARVTKFRFRAVRPLFDTAPFAVCGTPGEDGAVNLWARQENGALAMTALAEVGS